MKKKIRNKRVASRMKRHVRIKLRMRGTSERPRLVIKRSLGHISAQVIDDASNKTLFSFSTMDKEIRGKVAAGGSVKGAEAFGVIFAQKAKEKGITQIIFDRAGYLYHGRVKAFADSLRKGGLTF